MSQFNPVHIVTPYLLELLLLLLSQLHPDLPYSIFPWRYTVRCNSLLHGHTEDEFLSHRFDWTRLFPHYDGEWVCGPSNAMPAVAQLLAGSPVPVRCETEYPTPESTIFWHMTPCSPLSCNRRFCLPPAYMLVLAELFLRPWRWRRYAPPKRRLQLNGLHGVICQKMILFITTAVETSNPTYPT
jgi:hypothetical protein